MVKLSDLYECTKEIVDGGWFHILPSSDGSLIIRVEWYHDQQFGIQHVIRADELKLGFDLNNIIECINAEYRSNQ